MSYRRQLFASTNSGSSNGGSGITSSKDLPEFNIALLGTLGVGKSALTVKYITKRFIMEYDPEIEDTYSKVEVIDGQEVRVRLMDTYETDCKSPDRYLKWANAFLVVYNITDRSSFDNARTYLETIAQYQRITGKDIPVALVGNKIDLERYRTVMRTSGEDLAAQFESAFYETSAADDYGPVAQVFVDTVREVARVQDRQMPLQALFISEDRATSGGGGGGLYRRTKSMAVKPPLNFGGSQPLTVATGNQADKKDDAAAKLLPRRTAAPFKFFNKGFKIFNNS